jgi:hypothetical protein
LIFFIKNALSVGYYGKVDTQPTLIGSLPIDQAAHSRFGWLFDFLFSINSSLGFSGTLEIKETLVPVL